MKICKVVGKVWATRKHACLKNRKLLLVVPFDTETQKTKGETVMAVDLVDAGEGSVVLVSDEGNSARGMLDDPVAGIRTVVCGIIDETLLDGKHRKFH
ncbi:MAG: EutN/CcmL family microcompartment protein [Elusimicrobiota bacterium]|nr:EutN/CcmL family microcompartment protein [Elusimicrobiota bacterium]